MTKAARLAVILICTLPTLMAEERTGPPAETKSDSPPYVLTRVLPSSASNQLLLVPRSKTHPMIAVVEDKGDRAEIVRIENLGKFGESQSHYISADGTTFGAVKYGAGAAAQRLILFHANIEEREVFVGFGELGGGERRFVVSDDGTYVVSLGTLGVVCWKRRGNEWAEAWAIDYWKQQSDWPLFAQRERLPSFDALIPPGADYALITFNGAQKFEVDASIASKKTSPHYVIAVNLNDGKERWRFDVPPAETHAQTHVVMSPDGNHVAVEVLVLTPIGYSSLFCYRLNPRGELLGEWKSEFAAQVFAIADKTGFSASYNTLRHEIEMRREDGSTVWTSNVFTRSPSGFVFSADGKTVFLADNAGEICCLNQSGKIAWTAAVPNFPSLAARGDQLYVAGSDGTLQRFNCAGKRVWTLDCNAPLKQIDASKQTADQLDGNGALLVQVSRAPTTSRVVPKGENVLRNGKATLKLFSTGDWKTMHAVELDPAELTNGKFDDVEVPWLKAGDENTMNAVAEIEFLEPTNVHSLTVYENSKYPKTWPSAGFVQVWDEAANDWRMAARGFFLVAPTNTYTIEFKAVKRLRYIPWNYPVRPFKTCEIEVR